MKDTRSGIQKSCPAALTVAMVLMLAAVAGCTQSRKSPAQLVPDDVLFFAAMPDFDRTVANFKRTGAYGLYTDPTMQKFVTEAEEKMLSLFEKANRKSWESIGLDVPLESLPRPWGKVLLAVGLESKTVREPVYDMENFDGTGTPDIKEYKTRQVPDAAGVVLAEMGGNIAAARRLLEQIADKSVENGWTRSQSKAYGIDTVTLTPPQDALKAGDEVVAVMYAFHGETIVVATHARLFGQVLERMSGAEVTSLADAPEYKRARKTLGDGDAVFYLNAHTVSELILDSYGMGVHRKRAAGQFQAMGLSDITSITCVLQFASRAGEEFSARMLLQTRRQSGGLLGALVPPSISTKPGPLLTSGLSGFTVLNYDLGSLYDQIRKIMQAAYSMDIDSQVQMAMWYVTPRGEKPMNLRKDMIGQLAAPVTMTSKTDAGLVAIPVRDHKALEAAIERLHTAFVSDKSGESRRELKGMTLYLLPIEKAVGWFLPIPAKSENKPPSTALVVTKENLFIGTVSAIERAVGDMGGKDIRSIRTDPMYIQAARFLPDMAGIYFYRNQQLDTVDYWNDTKKAAIEAAREGDETSPPNKFNLGVGTNGLMGSVFGMLEGHCDFGKLPDFEAVKKYWGASVGHVARRDDGVYAEYITVSPPKD